MINNSDYQGLDISLEASQLFHLTEGQNVKSAIQFLYHKQLGERMLAMKIHEKAMLRTTSIKVATDCWALEQFSAACNPKKTTKASVW